MQRTWNVEHGTWNCLRSSTLLSILFIFLTITGHAQPPNTNISNSILFDGEPFLAMNPVNSQNLVVAWMGLQFTSGQFHVGIKTRASFDGGSTWSPVNTLPHMATTYGSADPSLAFDKNGLLYACYIDYRQSPDSGGIYVTRSANGGLTWDTPSQAFDVYDDPVKRPIDRPWLVVDKSATANSGTLYITTKPAPWIPAPNRNYFKTSSDSGHTWTTLANVDGGTHLVGGLIAQPMATPAVTMGGAFCAAYPSYVTSQNPLPAFYLSKSWDKGQNINYTTLYAGVPGTADTNLKNGYLLLAQPVDSNKLVFLLPHNQGTDQDIWSFSSADGGNTWTSQLRVNDDTLSNGKDQDMVWGAYNETGNLVVTWRDRRNSAATGFWNADYDFYYATSTDNGTTFSSNQLLSSQLIAFDSLLAQNGNDFMSSAYHSDTLYTVWGDTRNGKMNIYFSKTIASLNTSIEMVNLNGEPSFTFTPNPAGAFITIRLISSKAGHALTIFSSTGNKMMSVSGIRDNASINVAPFPPGIYFINIDGQVRRFIKK